jgi:pyruvate formate lyase activating enzyme
MREAMLWEPLSNERVACKLCAHRCLILPEHNGICQVRRNEGGILYSLSYGRVISMAVDPIEKKPLFHYLPGSHSLSVATPGCNFRCTFCQNADISQRPAELGFVDGQDVAPETVVAEAGRQGCRSISFTYTEPTIFFEYAHDVARLAREAGLDSVYVTNGYMTSEVLELALPADGPALIDAANVDLKAFRDAFYRRECGAHLQPVLDSLIAMVRRGVWVEVTTLVIPGRNDGEEELRDIARFVAGELGAGVPWHVSRFHPAYRLTDAPVTPARTLERAREIGREEGLDYVYVGNVPGNDGESTYCPQCGTQVVRRMGFRVTSRGLQDGACVQCGRPIAGRGW